MPPLITNIASLVTNDPSLGDGPPRPDPGRGRRHRRRPRRLGRRATQSTRHRRSRRRGRPRRASPASSTPTPTSSSRGDRTAGVQRPDVRPRLTPPAASARPSPRPAPRPTRNWRRNLARYLAEALRQGTTTFETKSGYGLTVEDEARALRIAARHTDEVTYLGAHIVAPDYADDPAAYVALVTGEMLDACAPYARWIDVFCEKGAFDGDQARAILTAGKAKGLHPARPRQPALLRPRRPARRRTGRRLAPTTARTSRDADVDALASRGHDGRHAAARRASSPPAPHGPTPAACSTRAPPSPCPRTATRARPSPPPCRSASRSPYGTWG